MTALEKLKLEHLEAFNEDGFPIFCPHYFEYLDRPPYCGDSDYGDANKRCTDCWNREIPEEKEDKPAMELKIKDSASLNMIVEALTRNGYHLEISTKWKEWPQNGIDYFCVLVKEKEDV